MIGDKEIDRDLPRSVYASVNEFYKTLCHLPMAHYFSWGNIVIINAIKAIYKRKRIIVG